MWKCKSLSCVQFFATPRIAARQTSLSMEFSRQEYWSGLPIPSPKDLPDLGLNPCLPHCRQILCHLSHQRSSGRRPKQTFFQRGYTDGQQAHEKMLTTTNHWRNANQNHEVSSHIWQNACHQKKNTNNKVGKDMEKKKPLYTVGTNVNWCNHSRKH